MTAGPSGSGGQLAHAVFTACQQSHQFEDRRLPLTNEEQKIGRSVARLRPQTNNAIFDCKVLSRNHAVIWYEDGKFYLRDTKSSNGTFVNNTRLSKGSEESPPKEIFSGDIIQFGVDIIENTKKKVTHGCIVALVRLFHPGGAEALGSRCEATSSISSSTNSLNTDSGHTYVNVYDYNDISSTELYQLRQYIREAAYREQMLENKLSQLTKVVQQTTESSNTSWQALIDEERLLSRIESLEAQLQAYSKNMSEDKLRDQLQKALQDKEKLQVSAKESLRRALEEKVEAVQKLSDVERSLLTTEESCTRFREASELAEKELDSQQQKYTAVVQRVDELQAQIREAEARHAELLCSSEQQASQSSMAPTAPIPDEPTTTASSNINASGSHEVMAKQMASYKLQCESLTEQLHDATEKVALASAHRSEMNAKLSAAQATLVQNLVQYYNQLRAREEATVPEEELTDSVSSVLCPLMETWSPSSDDSPSGDDQFSIQVQELQHKIEEQDMIINNLKAEVQTGKSLRSEAEQENEALRKHQMNTDLLLSQNRAHSKMIEEQLISEQSLKSKAYDERCQIKDSLDQATEELAKLSQENIQLQEKLLKVTEQLAEHSNSSIEHSTTTTTTASSPMVNAELLAKIGECDQQKARIADLETDLKAARKECSKLESDNRKLKEAYDSMVQLKQSLESNEATWREQVDSTSNECAIIRNQLAETRRELESTREQRNTFEMDLAASKRESTPPSMAAEHIYDDLLLQTQTITIASAVPLLMLFLALVCAWLPFFSWLTATVDPAVEDAS